MDEGATHLESVGSVVGALTDLGLSPVLVGAMALVVLGSRRVTRDFDFVVASPGDALDRLLDVFYDRGFERDGLLGDTKKYAKAPQAPAGEGCCRSCSSSTATTRCT